MIDIDKKRKLINLIIFTLILFLLNIALNIIIERTNEQSIRIFFYFLGRKMDLNLLDILIRLFIYITPILLFLKIENENVSEFLKLKCNFTKTVAWLFLSIAVILGIWILGIKFYFPTTKIPVNINFDPIMNADKFIRAVILTAIVEELAFRGFIFQRLMQITKFWTANILNGIIFALHHIPFWLINTSYTKEYWISNIIGLVLFSMVQGVVLKKTKSIWICMGIHMFNNYLGLMIIGYI